MRIYSNMLEAVREVERDLAEMGIVAHPQTMQDKHIGDDAGYATKELQAYSFQITDNEYSPDEHSEVIGYFFGNTDGTWRRILNYLETEHMERTCGQQANPGTAYLQRPEVWNEFLHDGKFAYTYSERIAPQLTRMIHELSVNPDTRQAIINIHSNIKPFEDYGNERGTVMGSVDMSNMGGGGRIPCSMYYQLMVRNGKVDLIYTMRSCDFKTHFPIDICLASRMQNHVAAALGRPVGRFTFFAGSLHVYQKDVTEVF
jgi:hypothetical protein